MSTPLMNLLSSIEAFFFFKQKTAYEIMPSLVGSEMCIRDRRQTAPLGAAARDPHHPGADVRQRDAGAAPRELEGDESGAPERVQHARRERHARAACSRLPRKHRRQRALGRPPSPPQVRAQADDGVPVSYTHL